MKPKLSIITINFNNLAGLQKTFESVFDQTLQDFEYIVIDGGSTDGSKGLIEKYDDKIDYWVSEPDKGIYNAMNKGVVKATGEYLLFLNSGDNLYSKISLEKIEPFITNCIEIDIIYGSLFVVGQKQYIKEYPTYLSFKYFLNDTLPHPATLIKKQCFNSLVFDESLKIVSDWKFFIVGFSKHNFTYLRIDETISSFYLDGVSSNNPELISQEKKNVLESEFSFFLNDYIEIIDIREKYHLAKNSYTHIFKNLFNRIFN
jgi:glycosyltransferase involved in cell wall biosynthesis